MRNLTIKREKTFVGSLMKVHVYIEDHFNSEITINNVPCRKLGDLKNNEEKTFSLSKGQMFLIYPNVTTSYWPDKEDPWEYSWVSFCGSAAFNHANRLTDKSNPIINVKQTRKIEKNH